MGTLFGYHLAEFCDVTMLDRNHELLEVIGQQGLSVNDGEPRRIAVAKHPAQLFGSAVLFLFVKAVDTLQALRPFAGQLNPATPIVSLQNGVGNEDAIKTALGGAVAVVLGITTESSLSTGPGRARSSESGSTILGSGGAAPDTSKRMVQLLADSGLHASVVYDIRPHLWGKLVANAAINAISALLDCEAGVIAQNADTARLAQSIAQEAAQVAAGMKINLPYSDPWQYVTEVIEIGADSKSSMAFDLEMGHQTEIDHINGAITAAGRRIGVRTPYNDAMVRLIRGREALLKVPVRL
ncbi:MAG: 2-dehydropantoate 2-reductase [Candidatus Eremiobacteraeota bacterium]|nr:2-dehydropantoate 2-reductase [Candidatus Eremiobacteraeota bacterium]